MKSWQTVIRKAEILVAPARERGLKLNGSGFEATLKIVAPARERGLKCIFGLLLLVYTICRSREGAWIEIDVLDFYWPSFAVAPAREHGLK